MFPFNIKFSLLITILCLVLPGCYYDNEEELYEYYYLQSACDVTSEVSFSVDIMPLIQNNCAANACHESGGAGNGIFDSYTSIKAKVDNGSLHQRVVVDKSMPPSQPLNACRIKKINAWINSGAPNN